MEPGVGESIGVVVPVVPGFLPPVVLAGFLPPVVLAGFLPPVVLAGFLPPVVPLGVAAPVGVGVAVVVGVVPVCAWTIDGKVATGVATAIPKTREAAMVLRSLLILTNHSS
ncbi:hypothetical protein DP116_13965 [Brasilonema bromeliae SPC951]|uniref:Uncharacterized protein n=1 Tax=Brasilonema bromeliae SPC951 TaxID=385972 RepID=A0ABX1P7V4_9CYAN|nr:hypothetical protein [Brasilonema bromeliae SPC951]